MKTGMPRSHVGNLCVFLVCAMRQFHGNFEHVFFFGRKLLPVDGVIVLSPYDLSYIPESVYM